MKAVGIDALTQMIEGDKASDDVGDDGELSLRPMIDSFAGRTRFFDDFLTAATDAGIRQMVIRASMHRVEPADDQNLPVCAKRCHVIAAPQSFPYKSVSTTLCRHRGPRTV